MRDYSLYIKYQSYVEFYRRVSNSINELGVARPSSSTIINIIENCRRAEFTEYVPAEACFYEKYDAIIHKVEQERINKARLCYVNSAAAQFTNVVVGLKRPSIKTVFKAMDAVISSVAEDLLDV